MGILDWLFGKGTNKEIEKLEKKPARKRSNKVEYGQKENEVKEKVEKPIEEMSDDEMIEEANKFIDKLKNPDDMSQEELDNTFKNIFESSLNANSLDGEVIEKNNFNQQKNEFDGLSEDQIEIVKILIKWRSGWEEISDDELMTVNLMKSLFAEKANIKDLSDMDIEMLYKESLDETYPEEMNNYREYYLKKKKSTKNSNKFEDDIKESDEKIENSKSSKPDWMNNIKWYEEGGEVTNPVTLKKYYLSSEELSIYDVIMGAKMFGDMSDEMSDIVQKALSWFRKNNPEVYSIFLKDFDS